MGGAGERQLVLGEAETVRRSTFDEGQRLDDLDRGTRKNGPIDIAEHKNLSPVGIEHRERAPVHGFHDLTPRYLDQDCFSHRASPFGGSFAQPCARVKLRGFLAPRPPTL